MNKRRKSLDHHYTLASWIDLRIAKKPRSSQFSPQQLENQHLFHSEWKPKKGNRYCVGTVTIAL